MTSQESEVRSRLADYLAGSARLETLSSWLSVFLAEFGDDADAVGLIREIQVHVDDFTGGFTDKDWLWGELKTVLETCSCGVHDAVETETAMTTLERSLATQIRSIQLLPTG